MLTIPTSPLILMWIKIINSIMVNRNGISFIGGPGLTLNGESELKHLKVSWCLILCLVVPSVAQLIVLFGLTGHLSFFIIIS